MQSAMPSAPPAPSADANVYDAHARPRGLFYLLLLLDCLAFGCVVVLGLIVIF